MSLIGRAGSYGIRAILHVAKTGNSGTDLVSTRLIAEELDVPPAFLSKVVQHLTHSGILLSRRGAAGGVALGKPPEEITLREIVQSVGDDRPFRECVLGLPTCSDDAPCAMHDQWTRQREGIKELFVGTAVATLVAQTGPVAVSSRRQRRRAGLRKSRAHNKGK